MKGIERRSKRTMSDGLITDHFALQDGRYYCRRCCCSFQGKEWPRLLEALQAHRATCRDDWDSAIRATRQREKTAWRCPLCFVVIRARQAPLFLLSVIAAHVAQHASKSPGAHRCGACGSACVRQGP
jgi:hypothetical protein